MKKIGFLEKLFGNTVKEEENCQRDLHIDKEDMIKGIDELSETTVKEVMVPRIDVVFVSVDTPIEELIRTLTDCGHSRVPVYEETIDNVVGILYAKDMLKYLLDNNSRADFDLASIIRKAYFVPESKRLDSLLKEFQRRRVHIAVGVDEYGGVSGIVCLEDIIEEIVGDIQDEFDNEVEDIMSIGENVFLCDARVGIEDLNEALAVDLPIENFDTLGGFVFDLFGKIPVRYEKVTFRDLDFVIQDMDGHKIGTVKIVKKGTEGEDDT